MATNFKMEIIRSFDFFPKINDDFAQKTKAGGAISILSFFSMGALFFFLLDNFLNPPITHHFFVPSPQLPFKHNRTIDPDNLPKMSINFDIFLHRLPCSYLQVNVIDIIKESDESANGKVKMERYDKDHNRINQKHFPKYESTAPEGYCGSCFGMKEGCCNTCRDVRKAFKAKNKPLPPMASIPQCTKDSYFDELKKMKDESCRIFGSLQVHQYPGTFHIAPGDEEESVEIYQKLQLNVTEFNISHTILHFNIGKANPYTSHIFDNFTNIQDKVGREKVTYFLRLVPVGLDSDSYSIGVSQYNNYRKSSSSKFPGIFFNYDISPISVYSEPKRSLLNFLVELSAILGGVFSIATVIDSLYFQTKDVVIHGIGRQYELLSTQTVL